MSDLTKEQQGKLAANAEYQKAITIVMNLATASLAIPLVVLKNFGGADGSRTVVQSPHWLVITGWLLLLVALISGGIFHYASGKFVKAIHDLYGADSSAQEKRFEKTRDISIGCLVPSFSLGLVFQIIFCAIYPDIF